MSKAKPYIIIKAESRKQRRKFKEICKSQGIPVCRAIPLLMRMVIKGEVSFEKKESIIKCQ